MFDRICSRMMALVILVLLACASLVQVSGDVETAEGEAHPVCIDDDGDGFAVEHPDCWEYPEDPDCNDADRFIHPDQMEMCDGIDNNCDNKIDDCRPYFSGVCEERINMWSIRCKLNPNWADICTAGSIGPTPTSPATPSFTSSRSFYSDVVAVFDQAVGALFMYYLSLNHLKEVFEILEAEIPDTWTTYLDALHPDVLSDQDTVVLLTILGHDEAFITDLMADFGVTEGVPEMIEGGDYSCDPVIYQCVPGNLECQVFDSDFDGYNNVNYDCLDCTDCNDNNPAIHPGAPDDLDDGIDNNCNGEDGDTKDEDTDGIPDIFETEICVRPDLPYDIIDKEGCAYTAGQGKDNIPGWSAS